MHAVRFGTSSWTEKSWVGSFYPAGTRPAEMLPLYAARFDTVEVDSTYYRRPSASAVARWAEVTPPGFVLSTKLPRTCFLGGDARELDAERVLSVEAAGEEVARHAEVLAGLGSKCGPVLIQCPWFSPAVFRDLSAFLARLEPFLAQLPPGPRFALEVRNRGWLHDELLELLRQRRVALCLAEVRGMPHPAELLERRDLLTTDFFYGRLIGDRSAVERLTQSFDKPVVDQSASLARWTRAVTVLATRADGWVYANNHFAGFAPHTADALRTACRAQGTAPTN